MTPLDKQILEEIHSHIFSAMKLKKATKSHGGGISVHLSSEKSKRKNLPPQKNEFYISGHINKQIAKTLENEGFVVFPMPPVKDDIFNNFWFWDIMWPKSLENLYLIAFKHANSKK